MDYFQGVVEEYLRADRGTFVNPECYVQLHENEVTPKKGTSWYIDLMAVNFQDQMVYLCEVTYSKRLTALLKRLSEWAANWLTLVEAVHRNSNVPITWGVRPWIFVPEAFVPRLVMKMPALPVAPRITTLEMAEPWRYSWGRQGEADKPDIIPDEMKL